MRPVAKEDVDLLVSEGFELVEIRREKYLQDDCCRCEQCGEWFTESFTFDNGMCDECDPEAEESRAVAFAVDVARGK
jgi:hypothetical protein